MGIQIRKWRAYKLSKEGENELSALPLSLVSPEGAVESLDRIRGRDALSRLGSKSTELADSGGREKHSNRDFQRAGDILERFSSGTSTREAPIK